MNDDECRFWWTILFKPWPILLLRSSTEMHPSLCWQEGLTHLTQSLTHLTQNLTHQGDSFLTTAVRQSYLCKFSVPELRIYWLKVMEVFTWCQCWFWVIFLLWDCTLRSYRKDGSRSKISKLYPQALCLLAPWCAFYSISQSSFVASSSLSATQMLRQAALAACSCKQCLDTLNKSGFAH